MDDKTLEMSLLFDFFGDLLTDKQKEYFDLYYNDDLSLSEIAEISGISRQGVRDNIIRAENALREYEEKTGVVKRFDKMRRGIYEIRSEALLLTENDDDFVRAHAESIVSALEKLEG